MEVVYDKHGDQVRVRIDCLTGLTIPRNVRQIAAVRRGERTNKRK
jgi:hypothetical protein